ncbi:MAG: DUF2207 family protein [Candidatus Electrothrix sp. YB6]
MKALRQLLPCRNAPEYLSAPPGNLSPELAGFLLEQKFKPRFITASIFELAHQGAIRIEPPHDSNSNNFIFRGSCTYTFSGRTRRFSEFIENAKVHDAFRELLVLQDDGTLNRLEEAGDEMAGKLRVLLKLWNTIFSPEEAVGSSLFEGEFLQKLKNARTCRRDIQHWPSVDPKESLKKIYRLYKSETATLPYEKILQQSIVNSRGKLSELEKGFSNITRLKRSFYERSKKHDFFPLEFNDETRFMWGCIGPFLLYIALFSIANHTAPGTGLLLAAVAIAGFFIIKKKSFRTPKGKEEAAKLLAFKRYLKDKNTLPEQNRRQEEFEAFLPYAIAFGVERHFIRKFVSADIPAPAWWISKERGLSLKSISADLKKIIRSITKSVSSAGIRRIGSGRGGHGGGGGGYTSTYAGATSGFGGGSSGGGGGGCCGGGGG